MQMEGNQMAKLSFNQKKTLAAYETFFGSEYSATSNDGNNTELHVEVQKMCYLLKIAGIEIGDFNYSWNFRGPFSPGLLVLLRSIDRIGHQVSDFYADSEEKEKVLSENAKKISEISKSLEIKENAENKTQWAEILGSIAYISRTVLPGESFEIVNKKFVQEKSEYNDVVKNQHAWDLLNRANLLSAMVVC